MVDINKYVLAVYANMIKHPQWRYGQALFNTLYQMDQKKAEQIRATKLDPFYAQESEISLEYWTTISSQ